MKRIVTFGEIMLRLTSLHHERLFQSPALESTFGGGEANVAVSLSHLGNEVSFVTALPENPVGDAAVAELRKHGVDVSHIVRTEGGRVGIYFLEIGANQRPSQVWYDRNFSAIATVSPDRFDWETIFADACWFHVTGITPAISKSASVCAITAVREARRLGLTVSIDLNYRSKLWQYGEDAPSVMRKMVHFTDVVMANEEDIQRSLGIGSAANVASDNLDPATYEALARQLKSQFPHLRYVAITMRESLSADRNRLRAVMLGSEGFFVSPSYQIEDIVDRVGGGDAFSAALIHGLLQKMTEADVLRFAVAASSLKHSIPGDFNLVGSDEVENLMRGDGSGRVRR